MEEKEMRKEGERKNEERRQKEKIEIKLYLSRERVDQRIRENRKQTMLQCGSCIVE